MFWSHSVAGGRREGTGLFSILLSVHVFHPRPDPSSILYTFCTAYAFFLSTARACLAAAFCYPPPWHNNICNRAPRAFAAWLKMLCRAPLYYNMLLLLCSSMHAARSMACIRRMDRMIRIICSLCSLYMLLRFACLYNAWKNFCCAPRYARPSLRHMRAARARTRTAAAAAAAAMRWHAVVCSPI